jgi:hypothetical protein
MRLYSLAALFTTLTTLANADIIQFVGAPTGVNDGNYYVLPYEVTIDGIPQLVVCYDIYDEVYSGDTWQAQLLDLNQAASSGFFSTTSGALADYEEIAWLDAQTHSTPAEQIGLQYAIWDVFGTYGSTPESLSYAAAANAAEASGYAGFSFSGARFIQQPGASAGQQGTEQTFVYWNPQSYETASLPEPGTVPLFVLGCISLAGMARIPSASFSSKLEFEPARTALSQRKRASQKAN